MTPEQRTYFLLGMQCTKDYLAESLHVYRRALAEASWHKEDFDYNTVAVSVLEMERDNLESYIEHKEQDDT
jgi:hypothetical protein